MKQLVVVALVVVGCGKSSEAPPTPIPISAVAPEPPMPAAPPAIERRLYPRTVNASSFLESETLPYRQYHPNYAADGDPKTAWNEGAPGDGPGEWLQFLVTPQQGVSKVRLRFLNGFQYDDAIWKANARAKTIEISLGGKPRKEVLADTKDWQEIAFATETPALDTIRIQIVDVYPGAKFKDLAISEVEIYVTSQTPEKPDVEKKQLDALLAWKKSQREMAELKSMAEVDLVTGAATKLPSDPLLERAKQTSPGSMRLVTATAKDDDVSAESILDCYSGDTFYASCFSQLYTTLGVVTHPVPDHNITIDDCHPTVRASFDGNGAISELALARCDNQSVRDSIRFEWDGIVLEYDDNARLRAAVSKEHTTWFEWGKRDGKPAIVGGAWTDSSGAAHALQVPK